MQSKVVAKNVKPNTKWIVFYEGMGLARGNFEWEETARTMRGYNFIFFNDDKRKWYQDCVEDVLGVLTHNIKEPGNSLHVGISGGGYAALLFAYLFGASSLALSPQTNITREFNDKYNNRYKDKLPIDLIHPDISHVKGFHHNIAYPIHNENDTYHAERMFCTLIPVDYEYHNIMDHIDRVKLIQEKANELKGGTYAGKDFENERRVQGQYPKRNKG